MITFKFGNANAYIESDNTPEDIETIAKISHCLSYLPKGSIHTKDPNKKFKMYSMLYEAEKFTVFPTGLIPFILEEKHKIKREDGRFDTYAIEDVKLIDHRKPIAAKLNPIKLWNNKKNEPLVLHDYQQEALKVFLERKRGIIRMPTGSGKSALGFAVIQTLGLKTLFVVNNKTLLRQTVEEFKLKANIDAGVIGDGIWELADVTVAIINTLYKRRDTEEVKKFLASRELVVFDETQHASHTFQIINRMLKNAYWRLGLSATVMMGGKEEKLRSQALTGPLIYDVKMEKLVEKKQLAKPTAIFIRIPRQDDDPRYDLMDWNEQYATGVTHHEFRNMILAYSIMEMRKRGYGSLVLVEKLDQGENIMELLKTYRDDWKVKYVSGKHSTDIREEARLDLQSKALDVLVASRIYNEGTDIPLLESVVIASGYKGAGLTYQRYGRGVRKAEKKDWTTIFDCYDEFAPKLKEHSDARFTLARKNKAFDVELIEWQDIPQVLDDLFKRRKLT